MVSTTPQMVDTRLTRAGIFLVVTISPGNAHRSTVLNFCGDLQGLLRAVGFRDLEGSLSCVMAFGSDAWDRLFGSPRPKAKSLAQRTRTAHLDSPLEPGDLRCARNRGARKCRRRIRRKSEASCKLLLNGYAVTLAGRLWESSYKNGRRLRLKSNG